MAQFTFRYLVGGIESQVTVVAADAVEAHKRARIYMPASATMVSGDAKFPKSVQDSLNQTMRRRTHGSIKRPVNDRW